MAAVAAVASGCGDEPRDAAVRETPSPPPDGEPVATPTVDPAVEAALSRPRVARLLRRCPVTEPNHEIPPGEEDNPGAELADYHGEGRLWTVLAPSGVLVADSSEVRKDGSIERKFPWWRGEEGELTITGDRLDVPGDPVRANIPSGYGPTGFQSTAISFAGEGCWRVVGTAGTARMTFVTLVVKGAPA